MSPVDPRPVVMGTMGLPSTPGIVGGVCFLPMLPAAFNSVGPNKPPVMVPSAARNERRFQPNFRFMRGPFSSFVNYLSGLGAGGLTTKALPTISISESPGIHSRAMQAREG